MHGVKPNRRHTEQMLLRLLPDQERRLDAVAKYKGKTKTDFVRDAVMESVDAVEEERRAKKRAADEDAARAFVPRNPRPPRGFLSRKRGRAQDADASTSAQAASPAPTVIVNAAPPPASAPVRDEVDRLALYVVDAEGNRFEAERRREHVEGVIRATAADQADAERLARSIDERVASLRAARKASAPKSPWEWLAGSGGA